VSWSLTFSISRNTKLFMLLDEEQKDSKCDESQRWILVRVSNFLEVPMSNGGVPDSLSI